MNNETIILTETYPNGYTRQVVTGECSKMINSAYKTDVGVRYYARTVNTAKPMPYPHGIFCESFSRSYRNRRVKEETAARVRYATAFPQFSTVEVN